MTTDNKRYELRTLKDIAQIPKDRLDEFYADLKDWLEIVRMTEAWKIEKIVKVEDGFTWIDDNKRGVSSIHIDVVQKQ